MSSSSRTLFMAAAAGFFALASFQRSILAQSFVYDTRAMVADGSWDDWGPSIIGGSATSDSGGIDNDQQTAQIFQVSSRTRLTLVTFDTIEVNPGFGIPSGGFLVEVFANIAGDHPAETPTSSLLVPPASCTFDGLFQNSTSTSSWGVATASQRGDRATWSINLLGDNIVLDGGTWWISVTAKNDGDPFGSNFRCVASHVALGQARAHFRCGGIDHGNGYPCYGYPAGSTNGHPDWTANPTFSFSGYPGTISIRIEGTVQNECTADFNASGNITVQDIFDFLSAWFSGDSRADFNRSGGITVQDIFDFLTAWFGGC
jgi:hypothetical protein